MRIGLLIGMTLLAAPAFAGPHDFVVQLGHVGGDAQAAAPYIAQFMRYAEEALKWPPNSASGEFATKEATAVAYIEKQKPGFGIFDPEVFFSLHKKYDLQVIASVQIKDLPTGRLSVVVKNPAYKSLADLKGKTVVSNYLGNPKYISKIVFEGKLDAEKDLKLEPTSSPSKGLKKVAAGEADATIVDDAQLEQMKQIDPGLKSIYQSPKLPATPAVAFGKHPEKDAFAKMVLGMCGDKKGAEVCKNLRIEKFTPPDKAAYDEAIRRYEK
jgi:hypothetical protein